MSVFRNFPIVQYNFGDNEPPALFQNLTLYVDLVDQIKDDVNFYEQVTILDGERPDSLSYNLYGTVDYYWLFYLINDNLRISGWPLRQQDVETKKALFYPNYFVETELSGDMTNYTIFAENFTVGKSVKGQTSAATGTIVERNLDLLQMTIKLDSTATFTRTENLLVNYNDIELQRTIKLVSAGLQYNATHHYEDTSGNWVDIPWPSDDSTFTYSAKVSGLVPVTNYERLVDYNEDLKTIKVLKPQVATQIFNEFQKLIKNNLA